MSIIDTISQAVTPAMQSKIAGMLGATEGSVDKAMKGAVPGALLALLGATRSKQGEDAFAAALAQQDPGGLGGVGSRLANDANGVAVSGGRLLSSIIGGGRIDAFAAKLREYSGVPEGGSGTLLGIVGTLVMGALGRTARERGLDARGVLNALAGEKDTVARALPADFAGMLSGTGLLPDDAAPTAAPASAPAAGPTARPATAAPGSAPAAPHPASRPAPAAPGPASRPAPPPPRPTGRPWWHWLIGLVVLALVLWLLAGMMGGEEETVEETAPAVEGEAGDDAPAAQ
jgi:hypothetical protein